ncbi:uncharacterized protein LOC130759231 [Actinidia eriantha]|uniref:uncharacterized protein LOC130759231 n=1 Tax=Actinidia eriantha TaxID=165200 RepID=UPI002589C38A|nr:uncharacterized protein LOC130759231 [Actinidia eriantha]XP_057470361.1 uncharacterized protein LOC130759231 [Actinidia eriantha]XP_057470362.1 uncharacterized protein LOC130759231 [Actinidia eriantha]
MKLTWKNQDKNNKRPLSSLSHFPNLPFDQDDDRHGADDNTKPKAKQPKNDTVRKTLSPDDDDETATLAEAFHSQGNKLAEDGRYREALGKWETALTLMPERAVLHEQKAQVLLEIGESWNALKAAKRATELEPSWAEAWITLGRAQLNFGEPDSAMESFDRALAIEPDSVEARDDRQTALHLLKRRKQLHSSGLSATENRYAVVEKTESS